MAQYEELRGKVVLVTGGSRGIGEGIVRHLAAQGAHVVFSYVQSAARAESIVAELGQNRCKAVQAELADPESIDRLWEAALEWKERVDVLINNAGVRHGVSMDAPTAEWDSAWVHALRVNLIATAHLSRLAILHFSKTSGGIIIGITGRIAVRGDRPEFLHDGASKGGMNSLLRGIARFYADQNITTFLVCAGLIDTGQATAMFEKYGLEEMTREIPAGRLGTPDDIAKVVTYLASGDAAYASGSTIDVVGASFLH